MFVVDKPEPVIVAVAGPLAIVERLASRRNYSRMLRSSTRFIVLHCTDGHESTHADTDVAVMFQQDDLASPRSSTFVVDSDSVTRCVPDDMVAFHCGHVGNHNGEGVELCGRAAQSRAEWLDALSLPMLNIAARLVADRCAKYGIPPVVLNDRALRAGERGITTHSFVTMAWRESTHSDPGPGFPLGSFVDAVARALSKS